MSLRQPLLLLLLAAGALAGAGCVTMEQVQAIQHDISALRTDVDALRKMHEADMASLADLRGRLESADGMTREARADLELRMRSLEEKIRVASQQDLETVERLRTLEADLTAIRQTRSAPVAAPAPEEAAAPANGEAEPAVQTQAGAEPSAPAALPPPARAQELFNAAYSDYASGRYPLAIKGFEEFLRQYGSTGLADNARYWIGVCRMDGGDLAGAIGEFDRLLRDYPQGDRVAAALLKKSFACLDLNRRDEGIAALKTLVGRYPESEEARVARTRLASLGVAGG